VSHALQRVNDRESKVSREIVGLVEPSLALTCAMEWNRHGHIAPIENIGSRCPHQRRETGRNRPPTVILQGMDHGP
jgi:hypothetical protein